MEPGERPLNGYSDRLSVRPGETVRFHVSCDGPGTYRAQLVRLICADDNPAGAPFSCEPIEALLNGIHEGRARVIHAGSHGIVPASRHFAHGGAFTLQALVMPTSPAKGRQGIVGTWSGSEHAGASLIVGDDGAAGLVAGDGRASVFVTTGEPMVPRRLVPRCRRLRSGHRRGRPHPAGARYRPFIGPHGSDAGSSGTAARSAPDRCLAPRPWRRARLA